jgi:hypothetical protein
MENNKGKISIRISFEISMGSSYREFFAMITQIAWLGLEFHGLQNQVFFGNLCGRMVSSDSIVENVLI